MSTGVGKSISNEKDGTVLDDSVTTVWTSEQEFVEDDRRPPPTALNVVWVDGPWSGGAPVPPRKVDENDEGAVDIVVRE